MLLNYILKLKQYNKLTVLKINFKNDSGRFLII